jgi:hypothetical protein
LDFGPIFKIMPRGGHFPALEQPTLWMDGSHSRVPARPALRRLHQNVNAKSFDTPVN